MKKENKAENKAENKTAEAIAASPSISVPVKVDATCNVDNAWLLELKLDEALEFSAEEIANMVKRLAEVYIPRTPATAVRNAADAAKKASKLAELNTGMREAFLAWLKSEPGSRSGDNKLDIKAAEESLKKVNAAVEAIMKAKREADSSYKASLLDEARAWLAEKVMPQVAQYFPAIAGEQKAKLEALAETEELRSWFIGFHKARRTYGQSVI